MNRGGNSLANNLITNFTQFLLACYSLLHAFTDPPDIIKSSFAYPEIQHYYSCISIIMAYSSVELYIKKSGYILYKHLNGNLDLADLPTKNRKDSVFIFHNWNNDKDEFVKHKFESVLIDIPAQARKRLNTQKIVLDVDIQKYATYRKEFNKAKKLRDHLIHGSFDFSLPDDEFEKIYVWKKKENKLSLDVSQMPEKALDFLTLSLEMLKYFSLVSFTGVDGNTREHIIEAFNIKELLFESVPYEYGYGAIPKQLIDLVDQKLTNYP